MFEGSESKVADEVFVAATDRKPFKCKSIWGDIGHPWDVPIDVANACI